MRAVPKTGRSKLTDKLNYNEFRDDLQTLMMLPYPDTGAYAAAYELWARKWQEKGEAAAVDWHRAEWGEGKCSHCFSMPGMPTTDNGLEGKNQTFKLMAKSQKLTLIAMAHDMCHT
jgi:hypothetical protein